MLIRIVRMTFRPEAVEDFLTIFDATAPRIRAFPGCEHLELWQDHHYPNILTTHSYWVDAEALEHYRKSDLFRQTWKKVKPFFVAPPHAYSNFTLRAL